MKILIRDYGDFEVLAEETLLSTLVRNNISLQNVCNGKGTCGKCKIRILKGVPEPTETERAHLSEAELEKGIRLACNVKPHELMEIETQRTEDYDRKNNVFISKEKVTLKPGLQKISFQVPPPNLQDERGDWDRINDELSCSLNTQSSFSPSLSVLEKLPQTLREKDYHVTVTLWGNQAIELEPGHTAQTLYGVAVDIGTTSVAAALVDLTTGEVLKVKSTENAQAAFGGDVISRISFAGESKRNLLQLKETILSTVNRLIAALLSSEKLSANEIYKMTVVANTTMSHLFLGLNVSQLAVSPYVSVYNHFLEFSAGQLGLKVNPEAVVQILPNIGSFVGSDTMGAVIGFQDVLRPGNHLLIDLGTNCELFLKTDRMKLACSTAAGPAFEGAGITHGMRAKPGAIEGVKITNNSLEVKVIGDNKASGICGSGLIEGIEQMRKAQIINKRGTIVNPKDAHMLGEELKSRIREEGLNGREFVLSYSGGQMPPDVCLNQKDIGEFQLAKGAVCAGIRTLVEIAGIKLQDLDSIVLAGTFASYLTKESILNIGLIPKIDPQKIKMAGNAAHLGAVRALIDIDEFYKASKLAQTTRHIELGGNKTFTSYFMKSMYLDPTN